MIIEGSVVLILKLYHESVPRAQAALATVQHEPKFRVARGQFFMSVPDVLPTPIVVEYLA